MLFMLLISNNYKNKPFRRKITNAEKYHLEVVKYPRVYLPIYLSKAKRFFIDDLQLKAIRKFHTISKIINLAQFCTLSGC